MSARYSRACRAPSADSGLCRLGRQLRMLPAQKPGISTGGGINHEAFCRTDPVRVARAARAASPMCRCSGRLESNHRGRSHGRAPRSHRPRRHRTGACRRPRCRAGDRQAVRAVSLRSRASLRQTLGCRGCSCARCAGGHVSRASGDAGPHLLQLSRRPWAERRPRSRRRTAGSRANPAAAARESESAAAAVCRQQRRRRLASDTFLPRQSSGARTLLADGRAVDGQLRSLHADQPDTLSSGATARTDEQALHEGLQRGQSARLADEHGAHCRADGPRLLLQREHPGAVE